MTSTDPSVSKFLFAINSAISSTYDSAKAGKTLNQTLSEAGFAGPMDWIIAARCSNGLIYAQDENTGLWYYMGGDGMWHPSNLNSFGGTPVCQYWWEASVI